MAEEIDKEEELIPVETPPAKAEPEGEGQDTVAAADAGDEDDGDERIGADAEAAGGEDSATARRRKQRRDHARQRRDQTLQEMALLRQQNEELVRRLGAVENHAISTNEATIASRYQQAVEDVRQAEEIFAQATSEGKGDYAAQALRIRDAATAEANRLAQLAEQTKEYRKAAEQQVNQPPANTDVQRHAAEWMRDNPWYDPTGADEVSALTKQIDAQIAGEGINPAQRGYWEELTRRVTAAIDNKAETPGRNAPPMGNTREHAPATTRRNEIFVTPERKAAMVDAGIWDDPVRRQRVLKEYRDYDKQAAR